MDATKDRVMPMLKPGESQAHPPHVGQRRRRGFCSRNFYDNNLTPEQQSYLRGKRYNREKGKPGRPDTERAQNGHVVETGRTSERLAAELKVGHNTIKRDGEFSAAVDKLAATHGPDHKNKYGKMPPSYDADNYDKVTKLK